MLSIGQLLLAGVIGAVISLVVVVVYGRWSGSRSGTAAFNSAEAVLLAVVVGLSILFWRAAGNTPPLNEDSIPLVSPNDVLCPVVTYVCIGLFAGVRRVDRHPEWLRLRALLTLVSLIVNIATI